MPLVLICGQPCSGKSAVATQLAEMLRAKGLEVEVVGEDALHLDRNAAYAGERAAACAVVLRRRTAHLQLGCSLCSDPAALLGSTPQCSRGQAPAAAPPAARPPADVPSEKNTRGQLRATADRGLTSKRRVVLLDSLNNIKGYRYELWCCARQASRRSLRRRGGARGEVLGPLQVAGRWASGAKGT